MKLLTFRVGRGAPRLGALAESVAVRGEPEASRVDESVVLDLAAIATDLGRGGGTARRRFPRTMLELVEGGAAALAMVGEVVEAGSARLRRDGVDALAGAKLAIAWGDTRPEAPIPRPARNVFGYTVVNDVTARDLQRRHGQWFKGKSLDTFCPMGPVLITADEIPDPQALTISLRLNGETRQSSHTSRMIFPVAQCIEVL